MFKQVIIKPFFCKVVVLLLACSQASLGQTFHALLIADTRDTKIGTSCETDLIAMNSKMGEVAKAIGYIYHPIIISEQNFGRAAIDSVLSTLPCTPKDILFCMYAGHGYTVNGRPNIFPLLLLKDNNGWGLDDLHLALKNKHPRLCITLGDCCSQLFPEKIPPSMRCIFRGIDVSKDIDILSKLFIQTNGDVIICSTQSGELAGSWPTYGGFYTRSWLEALDFAIGSNTQVTWENLLLDSKLRLNTFINMTFMLSPHEKPRQTPHWRINYGGIAPSPTPDPQPKPLVSFVDLNDFLNQLADENQYPLYETRAAIRESKRNIFFVPEAEIQIFINNPEKPVETQSLTRFLSRLVNNAQQVKQVNVIERHSISADNGKYQVLTVQEVR
ncbi:caspase family protein [Runella sp. MFBS21]|uniref:caspase family protein n=1 Tax=Runella sp. MFBS21 TaxID=3034018 RepID=UPI0023FA0B32|nr:caspase family protein [Runella sp. MFBS21]MDF7821813.1 caspase family protein [Runella sp. MFBS21]